jgi:acyl-CoA thioester hydrolase
MTESFTTEVRVRYVETDQMGVVHHSNYLNWFEVGRTEWMRLSDLSYRELEEDGILMPVTEVHVKYHAPARYDDLVRITTWIESYNKVRVIFSYEVRREDGELLVTGRTEHAFINRAGQVVRLHKTHPHVYERIAGKARVR